MESKVIKEFVVTLNNYLLIMRITKTRTDVNSQSTLTKFIFSLFTLSQIKNAKKSLSR